MKLEALPGRITGAKATTRLRTVLLEQEEDKRVDSSDDGALIELDRAIGQKVDRNGRPQHLLAIRNGKKREAYCSEENKCHKPERAQENNYLETGQACCENKKKKREDQ